MIVRARAAWVVPVIGPVLRDGWIDVDAARGEIVAIGAGDVPVGRVPDVAIDLGGAAVLPGLVNAHTHLELSHLAGVVPPAAGFVAWVRAMLAARSGVSAAASAVTDAIVRAIGMMEATGTAGVGDIGNTESAVPSLAASSLAGIHFREALGFARADADAVAGAARLGALLTQRRFAELGCTRFAASVAPHAPYSTSAPLIRALAAGRPAGGAFDAPAPACAVSSIHLGESLEEIELLARGTGPFRDLLVDLGKWDDEWQPPGVGPVQYMASLGVLHDRMLVVHGTQFASDDLRAVADAGATLVLCVRSNRWVGVGAPPVEEAFASGARIALGTDSLASVEDLNLFAELAAVRRHAPRVAASRLLRAATRDGAQALGAGALGYLGPGATSRAVVRMPPAGVADVEEWLVADASDTSDLRWLDALVAQAAG